MKWIGLTRLRCLVCLLCWRSLSQTLWAFSGSSKFSQTTSKICSMIQRHVSPIFLMNRFYRSIKYEKFLVSQPRLFQGNKRFFGRFVKFPKLSNICSKKVISTLCKIPSCHLLFEPKNPDSNRIRVCQLKLWNHVAASRFLFSIGGTCRWSRFWYHGWLLYNSWPNLLLASTGFGALLEWIGFHLPPSIEPTWSLASHWSVGGSH